MKPARSRMSFPVPDLERGVVLVVALIAMAAMGFSGMALMRLVHATTTITGNMAFRHSAASAPDAAVEHAVAALFEQRLIADPASDDPARSYYASRAAGEDARGIPAALAADPPLSRRRADNRRRERTQRQVRDRTVMSRCGTADAGQLHADTRYRRAAHDRWRRVRRAPARCRCFGRQSAWTVPPKRRSSFKPGSPTSPVGGACRGASLEIASATKSSRLSLDLLAGDEGHVSRCHADPHLLDASIEQIAVVLRRPLPAVELIVGGAIVPAYILDAQRTPGPSNPRFESVVAQSLRRGHRGAVLMRDRRERSVARQRERHLYGHGTGSPARRAAPRSVRRRTHSRPRRRPRR